MLDKGGEVTDDIVANIAMASMISPITQAFSVNDEKESWIVD